MARYLHTFICNCYACVQTAPVRLSQAWHCEDSHNLGEDYEEYEILNILNWVVLGLLLLSTSHGQNLPVAQGMAESTNSFEFDDKFESRHARQRSIELEILDESKQIVLHQSSLGELGDAWKLFLQEEKSYFVRHKTQFFGDFTSAKFSGGEDVTLTVELPSVT